MFQRKARQRIQTLLKMQTAQRLQQTDLIFSFREIISYLRHVQSRRGKKLLKTLIIICLGDAVIQRDELGHHGDIHNKRMSHEGKGSEYSIYK